MRAVLKKRLISVLNHLLAGAAAGCLFILLANWLGADTRYSTLGGGIAGMIVGLSLGFGEEFLVPWLGRSAGFYATNVTRTLVYGAAIAIVLIGGTAFAHLVAHDLSITEGVRRYVVNEGFGRDMFFASALSVLFTAYVQIRKLHNPGEILRLLLGRYQHPKEESRLFLFADLVGSTSVAERLGHLQYSRYLQDVFMDIAEAIVAYKGQVYQYSGDGIIVSWSFERGVDRAVCLRCFFEMDAQLKSRHPAYQKRYGVGPVLRGGVHGGQVVTTWVGEAKKEIAFHGDVVNTTSRIQWTCRSLGADCLVSRPVYERLVLPDGLRAKDMGKIVVKGRREPVELFAVEPVDMGQGRAEPEDASAMILTHTFQDVHKQGYREIV